MKEAGSYLEWIPAIKAAEVLGIKEVTVDGFSFSYKVIRWPGLAYVIPDTGEIFVQLPPDAPEHLREKFMDLIGYHEAVEYRLHQTNRIPFPREICRGGNEKKAILFHNQAHWRELIAAKNMGC